MPNNPQSVERAVILTSEASKQVYGYEKRHKFILNKTQSRRENKRNVKKCDYFIKWMSSMLVKHFVHLFFSLTAE